MAMKMASTCGWSEPLTSPWMTLQVHPPFFWFNMDSDKNGTFAIIPTKKTPMVGLVCWHVFRKERYQESWRSKINKISYAIFGREFPSLLNWTWRLSMLKLNFILHLQVTLSIFGTESASTNFNNKQQKHKSNLMPNPCSHPYHQMLISFWLI